MRGIGRKELLKLRDRLPNEVSLYNAGQLALLDELISGCKELNPWKPIDENTPKDKWILCWIEDLKTQYMLKFDTERDAWVDKGLRKIMTPDLYQELPDDSKE